MTEQKRRTVYGGAGVLACALALAASGCGGGSSAPTGAQSSVTLADHLKLALSEDRTSASVGDKVTYQLTLTNPTAAAITSTYAVQDPMAPSLEPLVNRGEGFLVKDGDGQEINYDGSTILTESSAHGVPAPLTRDGITITLQPGQTLSSTKVYTFMHPSVYTTTFALQKTDESLTSAAGPLTVTVH